MHMLYWRSHMRKKLQDLTIKDAFMFAAVMSDDIIMHRWTWMCC